MNPEKVGKFIRQLREEINISQYKLADMLFIDRTLVSKWENGKIAVDLKYIPALCEILNVDMKEIIYGERLINENKDEINETVSNFFNKQEKKYRMIRTTAIALAISIFIGIFAFLVYYFDQTYDTTKVYRVYGESDTYSINSGIMIVTRENTYFKIGNIDNSSNNIVLYSKKDDNKDILYEGDSNNVLVDYFNYNGSINLSNYEDWFENLYVSIDNQEIKLEFVEDYSNDSLLLQNKTNLSVDDNLKGKENLIPEKISNNFECDDTICTLIDSDNIITYDINDKLFNITIDTTVISYDIENNNFYYKDNKTEFNINNNELECISKSCDNYKKIYNNYFDSLIKKYI